MIAPALTLIAVLVADVFKLTGWINGEQNDKYVDVAEMVLQVFCLYTIVVVYMKLKQKRWQIIALYSIMVFFSLTIPLILQVPDPRHPSNYQYVIGVLYLISYVAFVVSVFRVRREDVKLLFRLYGAALIFSSIGSVIFTEVFQYSYTHALWQNPGRYINDVILYTSVSVLLLIYYKQYMRHEAFHPGSQVALTKTVENIPGGTLGTIVKKHNGSNFYEVEFTDDEGSLIVTSLISAKDMVRLEEPDLEARVDAFGRA